MPLFSSRARRRAKALADPFPLAWRRILVTGWAHWPTLSFEEQQRVQTMIQAFLATTEVEPANGFAVTDEQRVLVAAGAALLVLGLPGANDLERLAHLANVRSIVMHPSTVVLGGPRGTTMPHVVDDGPRHLLGQAELHGPVLLAWDAVRAGAARPFHGHDVVIHELAHALDMRDGHADGTPAIADRAVRQRWVEVATRTLAQLRRGPRDPVLRPYAATNAAEFFAVASEAFFGRGAALAATHPELYSCLTSMYGQDPAQRQLVGAEAVTVA